MTARIRPIGVGPEQRLCECGAVKSRRSAHCQACFDKSLAERPANTVARFCEGCGERLVRKPNEGFHWTKRRFCDAKCWDQNRPVTPSKSAGRSLANRLHPGEPCEVCAMPYGGRGRVQRHHIDGDTMNNDRSNIAFLCVAHHMSAHRARDGKGPGGGPRPRIAKAKHDAAVAKYRQAIPLRDAGWRHEDIAAWMGTSRSTVSRWFRLYKDAA